MFCVNCNTKLADDWNSCPKCGTIINRAKQTTETNNTSHKKNPSEIITTICGLIIIFVMVSFFTSCFSSRTSTTPSPRSQSRQVLLTAGFERGFIVIRNDNNFDWTSARIVVSNGPSAQYSLDVGTIKQGETKSYSLSKFVSGSGEIYDSRKYVPKQVLVYADNANGGRQY